VERPNAPEETAALVAHDWRTGPSPGTVRLRVLLLRAADGRGRPGRVRALVADGRLDDHVHGDVHVHVGHNHGE